MALDLARCSLAPSSLSKWLTVGALTAAAAAIGVLAGDRSPVAPAVRYAALGAGAAASIMAAVTVARGL